MIWNDRMYVSLRGSMNTVCQMPLVVVYQRQDRKSTRLNSSHMSISYAVFCLKKKFSSDARFRRSSPRGAALPESAGARGILDPAIHAIGFSADPARD